jgi:hypothetical protein
MLMKDINPSKTRENVQQNQQKRKSKGLRVFKGLVSNEKAKNLQEKKVIEKSKMMTTNKNGLGELDSNVEKLPKFS